MQKIIQKLTTVLMLSIFVLSSNSNAIFALADNYYGNLDDITVDSGSYGDVSWTTNPDMDYVTTGCGWNCGTTSGNSQYGNLDNISVDTGTYGNVNWTTNPNLDYVTTGCTSCYTYTPTTGGSTYVSGGWNTGYTGGYTYNPNTYYATPVYTNTGSTYVSGGWNTGYTGGYGYNTPVYVTPVVTPVSTWTNTNWNSGNTTNNQVYGNVNSNNNNNNTTWTTTNWNTGSNNGNTSYVDNSTCNGTNNCNTTTTINNNGTIITNYYCSINGSTYNSMVDFTNGCRNVNTPVTPAPTYYCALNGITYNSQNDYNNYCRNITPTPTTYYCSYNGYYYNTQAEYNSLCRAPVNLYCSLNGQNYTNANDYANGCKKYCALNGYFYSTQSEYDNYCKAPTNNFYCSINGQTYNNIYDFNNYCKINNNYYCAINGQTYSNVYDYNNYCKAVTQNYYCNINGETYYNINDYNNYCRAVNTATHRVVTTVPTQITNTSARCNAVALMTNGVQSIGYFEYGTNTNVSNRTNQANIGSVTSTSFSNVITGLTPNTTYYCRAVMVNKDGIYRGENMSFRTTGAPVKYVTEVVTKKVTKTNSSKVTKSNKGGSAEVICKDTSGNKDSISTGEKLVSMNVEKASNLTIGGVAEYIVKYSNLSRVDLSNVKLRITLPAEMAFVNSNIGTYDFNTNSTTINLNTLRSSEGREMRFAVKVSDTVAQGKTLIVNTYMSYEVLDESGETMIDEVTGYSIASVSPKGDAVNTNNVIAKKDNSSSNIFPNTLIEWMVILILVAILVILGRNIYKGLKGAKADDHGHDAHAAH